MTPTNTPASPVALKLFAPIDELLPSCASRRQCTKITDEHWLRIGVSRSLGNHHSGRAFLQHTAFHQDNTPGVSHFFAELKSPRRLKLVTQFNAALTRHINLKAHDPFAAVASLSSYDLWAGDGHYHAHAAHDPAIDGKKRAVGHIYGLNLRSHAMVHLGQPDASAKREHEMATLKRMDVANLRQGAGKGRKVIWFYDRACIDYHQWACWKHQGVYFFTRTKEGNTLKTMGILEFEDSAVNAGIISDELVGSSCSGEVLRRIRHEDPAGGGSFEFVTNMIDNEVPPGALAHGYRMRWDIEKTYDVFKNRMKEVKAWATGEVAKKAQALFLCVAHNLCLLLEEELEKDGVADVANDKRRAARHEEARKRAKTKGLSLPMLVETIRRTTQRCVKLIRWIAAHLHLPKPWNIACDDLRTLYAKL